MTETNTVQNKQSGCGQGTIRHQLSNHTLTVSHTRQQSMPHAHENEGHLPSRVGAESTNYSQQHSCSSRWRNVGESATTNSNLVTQLCRHSLLTTLRMPKLWRLRNDRRTFRVSMATFQRQQVEGRLKNGSWLKDWRRRLIIDADEDKDPEGQFCGFSSSVLTGVGLSLWESLDRVWALPMELVSGQNWWSWIYKRFLAA